ncbi:MULTISPECIES: hypothetical protein [Halomicrobium]|uniref:Uncharacterized protein n=1 Tax=Halomicrobium mukohataei (strain ATCC 700874 / DSM 12286 / JCM 9738 / NCIMB 13541) TaxID=485914 RepID=C7P3R2_HALMD|nr:MULTISPECIES: hypothetical protein [Halomicrobium]ACV47734.1 hypothetical protein Hmuk_1620 [Halomicrobium mukohataei DSM 12286]
MHTRTALCLLFVLLLAGCTAGPFSTGTPLTLGNAVSDSYRFEVSIAQIGENATVEWANGDTTEFDVTATGFSAESEAENAITTVDLPASTTRVANYTLAPGERKHVTVREVRQDETLFVVVVNAETERLQSFHGLHCRPGSITGANYTVRNTTGVDTYWEESCGP